MPELEYNLTVHSHVLITMQSFNTVNSRRNINNQMQLRGKKNTEKTDIWEKSTVLCKDRNPYKSTQFSCSVVSGFSQPQKLQHARPPCPSPTPRVYTNSCPLSRWCHPTISSSVIPFSSQPSIFPSIRVFSNGSALCIRWPKCWSFSFISSSNEYSGLISFRIDCWISLQSKGLSRVFPNTTVQEHQLFGSQLSL